MRRIPGRKYPRRKWRGIRSSAIRWEDRTQFSQRRVNRIDRKAAKLDIKKEQYS